MMKFTCTKCNCAWTAEQVDVFEAVDGYQFYCQVCGQLIVELPYSDQLTEEEMAVIPTKYLPNADQCRYMRHLIEKQLVKIQNARKQLEGMADKIEVLGELAKEREVGGP